MRLSSVILLVLMASAVPSCAPTVSAPQPGVRERAVGDARPTIAERAEVLGLSEVYARALGSGDLRAAFDLHTDDYRARVPFAEWRREVAGMWPGAGTPVEVLWRQGLHRWEGPELYAIVLWPGGAPRLVWRQGPDGAFLLESAAR